MNMQYQAWRIYRDAPILTRIHTLGRSANCAFSSLLPYFPRAGEILDIGCGHGFLLSLLRDDTANEGRRLTGMDCDIKKIEIARKHTYGDIRFIHADIGSLGDIGGSTYDAIAMTGILYAVSISRWKAVLDNCFRILRPGGTLVVKDAIDQPRWKMPLMIFEEFVAMYVVGMTRGDRPHIESISTYTDALKTSGFTVGEVKPMSWNWFSDCVFIAKKK